MRINRSSPCAALCTATLTMRPSPVAGTFFVDAASELLAAFQEVGALARQELVSCVPPALLAAQPGDVVADLCAAPGMKALQLLDAVGSKALSSRRRSIGSAWPCSCGARADHRRRAPFWRYVRTRGVSRHAAADRLEAEVRQGAV